MPQFNEKFDKINEFEVMIKITCVYDDNSTKEEEFPINFNELKFITRNFHYDFKPTNEPLILFHFE